MVEEALWRHSKQLEGESMPVYVHGHKNDSSVCLTSLSFCEWSLLSWAPLRLHWEGSSAGGPLRLFQPTADSESQGEEGVWPAHSAGNIRSMLLAPRGRFRLSKILGKVVHWQSRCHAASSVSCEQSKSQLYQCIHLAWFPCTVSPSAFRWVWGVSFPSSAVSQTGE